MINNEEKLLKKCLNGNRKAQLNLYKKYAKSMFYISLSIVRNSALAEDVVQEAFIAVFKNLTSFKGEVSFGAWMKKIVVNRSISALRKEQKFMLELKQQEEIVEKEIVEEEVVWNEKEVKLSLLKKAIKKLPERYSVMISLYYMQGYDHEEIAEILNISNENARTTLSRARVKLKKLMKE